MRKEILISPFIALALLTTAACTSSSRTQETTGTYIDDSAITAKVKAAFVGDPQLKAMQIGVETFKNTVQLSGFVDTPQTKIRAGEVAASVPGVRTVRNDLVVK